MEDYKQKYEKVRELAKTLRNLAIETSHENTRMVIEELFPELKESEDERIRKSLIKSYTNQHPANFPTVDGFTREQIIAWLEKQGENELQKYINDERNKKGFYYCGNEVSWNEMPLDVRKHDYPYYFKGDLDCYPFNIETQDEQKHLSYPIKDNQGNCHCWNNAHDIRPKHLQRCICYDKYMKGVYCYVYDDISKYWCTQMTEEHDNNGDNHVCDYADYRVTVWMPIPDTSSNVHDKVEPKFKVGDWVVCNYLKSHYIGQVTKVEQLDDETFGYTLDDGTYFSGSWQEYHHLWTIKDVNDGDVLSTENGRAFIFKYSLDYFPVAYCGIDTMNKFKIGEGGLWTHSKIKPSTKEQRELLFTKMKESGYEWNAEKRELRNIS